MRLRPTNIGSASAASCRPRSPPEPLIHIYYRTWSREMLSIVRQAFTEGLNLHRPSLIAGTLRYPPGDATADGTLSH